MKELQAAGYSNASGYDTSNNLIRRGQAAGVQSIHFIQNPQDLPIAEASMDAVILFAVLTCIPSNQGQRDLIQLLGSKLKPGGILYMSDYYLQENRTEVDGYRDLNGDPQNAGVFTLAEGVTFRHHSKEWIKELLEPFELAYENEMDVTTMNGHLSKAFQLVVRKKQD